MARTKQTTRKNPGKGLRGAVGKVPRKGLAAKAARTGKQVKKIAVKEKEKRRWKPGSKLSQLFITDYILTLHSRCATRNQAIPKIIRITSSQTTLFTTSTRNY